MNNHQPEWQRIKSAILKNRTPQALILVGPLHCDLIQFTHQVSHLYFCDKRQNSMDVDFPCYTCTECQMIQRNEHPDIEWVQPEKSGSSIKIDQIRALHHSVYLTPQRSEYRLVVLAAADRLNHAAANALLKILEEPPKHTVFILIAQQLSTVLPTIISRCQLISFAITEPSAVENLLLLGTHYPEESERAVIVGQAESILDGLIAIIEKSTHPSAIAAQWTHYELSNLVWLLYLAYAQIQYLVINKQDATGLAAKQLNKLVTLVHPLLIFSQLDKINAISRKLSHNITVNQLLVLEELLFSLL